MTSSDFLSEARSNCSARQQGKLPWSPSCGVKVAVTKVVEPLSVRWVTLENLLLESATVVLASLINIKVTFNKIFLMVSNVFISSKYNFAMKSKIYFCYKITFAHLWSGKAAGDVALNCGGHILPEVSVREAEAQDIEAGDGTTSVVVMAGALLKACTDLMAKGLHPTAISDGF